MRALAPLALATIGCGPLLPFHATETAEALQRGDVALTFATGAGGAGIPCCAGGGLRLRGGVGAGNELRGDLVVGGGFGSPILVSGRFGWKWSTGTHFALVSGAGGWLGTAGGGGGADLGFIVSTAPGPVAAYAGPRLSYAYTAPFFDSHAESTLAVAVPAGLAFGSGANRFYVEVGWLPIVAGNLGGLLTDWYAALAWEFRFEVAPR